MITVKNRTIMELADIYVKDGKLLKYRWYNSDINHNDNILHYKSKNNEQLTDAELIYVRTKPNLVIETNSELNFYNADDYILEMINISLEIGY